MTGKSNHYDVLGVSKNASKEDITKAYKKLVRKYHPDVNPNDRETAENKMRQINEAYEVLNDEDKRKEYDNPGYAFDGFADFGDFGNFSGFNSKESNINPNDLWRTIFENAQNGKEKESSTPQKGSDLKFTIEISFEEAVFGVRKEITVSREENCTHCNGTGARPGSNITTCPNCKGTGQTKSFKRSLFGEYIETVTCNNCNGKGKIVHDLCPECHGKTVLHKNRLITISIPEGIDNNQTIRIKGEGSKSLNGGENGDIYITVIVKPHSVFKRKENNVYSTIKVPFTVMTLGGEITIKTLTGFVKYKVEKGTQSNSLITLNGHGIKELNSKTKGSHIVTLTVDVPSNLTEEQFDLLNAFNKTFKPCRDC